ncbi:MAG: zinc-binding dehydrogenase [Candidatus Marinimicrobia bacterium]|nr:zinc-binding dehydrogenase [Candidatus Neomarinimicrobiota bacterium]
MKAVRINEHGGIDKLLYDEIDEPSCLPDKVKVKVKASALNHLDIWVRNGLPGLPIPLPLIMGCDASGTIVEIGINVNNLQLGDDVVIQPGTFCSNCDFCKEGRENYCSNYGILGETENGTLAEYIILKPANIYKKPEHLSFPEAASMPLVFMTAYQMLIKRAKLQPGEVVLIYGGSSGVGSAAIQICRDLGAQIIATAGNNSKAEFCKKLGANHVVNHNNENWLDDVKQIAGKFGVNVIFEHVGSATWKQSIRILSKGGRLVTCGATTGADVNINLAHLFMKQQSILGSTMSSVDTFKEVMNKIKYKKYKPTVDKIFAMKDIRVAHEYMERRQQSGKVVLVPEINE